MREFFRVSDAERTLSDGTETSSCGPDDLQVASGGCGAWQGKKVPKSCKLVGTAEQTYDRWRKKYGGRQPEMAKEVKALRKENGRLKKMVADQALDMDILKEAAKGNG